MEYFVHREGSNLGPYSLAEMQHQLAAGSITSDDLAWHEGLPQWQPVSTLISSVSAGPSMLPVANASTTTTESTDETRQSYFSHEQQVRSVGTFFRFNGVLQLILAALILLALAVAFVIFPDRGLGAHLTQFVTMAIEGAIFVIVGGVTFWAGSLLRNLDRKAFVPAVIVAAFGLLAIPIGTLINGFILYLLLCDKGRFVLSDPYRDVVAATPQYQWKTALWVKIIIGLMVLAFVLVVVISMLLALGNKVQQMESGLSH
jgi:hypothetical protein